MYLECEDFSRNFKFLRHTTDLSIGVWDLYKNVKTQVKYFVKEIKFYDVQELKIFMDGILSIAKFSDLDGQIIDILFYTVKKMVVDSEKIYKVFLVYEYYEQTLDKLKSKKIKESEKFNNHELQTFSTRMIKILANLEMVGCRHGDLRNSIVIIGPNNNLGEARILWVPFGKRQLELFISQKDTFKNSLNPSPEIIQTLNIIYKQNFPEAAFQQYEENIHYPKSDVYSLGMLVLRLYCQYKNDNFYIYNQTDKFSDFSIHTRKLEKIILDLHSENKDLSTLLNQQLIHSPVKRKSFIRLATELDIIDTKNCKDFPCFNHLKKFKESQFDFSPIQLHSENNTFSKTTKNAARSKSKPQNDRNQPPKISRKKTSVSKSPIISTKKNLITNGSSDKRKSSLDFNLKNQKNLQKKNQKTDFSNEQLSTAVSKSRFNSDSTKSVSSFNPNFKTEATALDLKSSVSFNKNEHTTFTKNLTQDEKCINDFILIKQDTSCNFIESTNDESREMLTKIEMQNLKNSFIRKLESAIFHEQNTGNIRKGLKLKEYSNYSKYIGEMFCGKRDGFGVLYYSNGDVCFGNFKENTAHGCSAYFHSDSSIFIGNVDEDTRKGYGRFMYVNCDVYEGEFDDNKKHGKGVYQYSKSEYVYDGNWLCGLKEKSGKWYKDNMVYSGEWQDGELIHLHNKKFVTYNNYHENIKDFYKNPNSIKNLINYLLETTLSFNSTDKNVQSFAQNNYRNNSKGKLEFGDNELNSVSLRSLSTEKIDSKSHMQFSRLDEISFKNDKFVKK